MPSLFLEIYFKMHILVKKKEKKILKFIVFKFIMKFNKFSGQTVLK